MRGELSSITEDTGLLGHREFRWTAANGVGLVKRGVAPSHRSASAAARRALRKMRGINKETA